MRYAVGLTANCRPLYMAEVAPTWQRAFEHVGLDPELAIVRHEPGYDQVQVTEAVVAADGPVKFEHVLNAVQQGPLVNPWLVLDELASHLRDDSDLLVLGEDDALVSRDALAAVLAMAEMTHRLPDWDPTRTFLCLNHRWARPLVEGVPDTAAVVTGAPQFCPTVWAVSRAMWREHVKGTWDHDYRHRGWDWNFSERLIPERGLRVMAPSLSRSTHIGRYGGAHTTEENWEGGRAPTFDPELSVHEFRYQEGPTP